MEEPLADVSLKTPGVFVTFMCLPATFGLFVFQHISERKGLETGQQTIEQGSLTLQAAVQNRC